MKSGGQKNEAKAVLSSFMIIFSTLIAIKRESNWKRVEGEKDREIPAPRNGPMRTTYGSLSLFSRVDIDSTSVFVASHRIKT